MNKKILVITGPTASGKSYLAEELLLRSNRFVVINADSMQVYEELPILSAQPTLQEGNELYRLYGFLKFYENCSVGLWLKHAKQAIEETFESGNQPVVVGGTGMYLKALLEGIMEVPDILSDAKGQVQEKFLRLGKEKFYEILASLDPLAARRIHKNDTYRMQRAMEVYVQTGRSISSFKASAPSYKAFHISIEPDRETLYRNCDSRFEEMLKSGAAEEVKLLFEKIKAQPGKYNIENTLGYRALSSYLSGELSLEDATLKTNQATRNYAKRQCTWLNNQFKNKTSIPYSSNMTEIKEKFLDLVSQRFKFS
jgi:tRNA dimethylallyltransferase